MPQDELHFIKRIENLEADVAKLKEFLPILGEVFAGRIGGTSDESTAVFAAFQNADPEALKAAIEANSGAAKSTENDAQKIADGSTIDPAAPGVASISTGVSSNAPQGSD